MDPAGWNEAVATGFDMAFELSKHLVSVSSAVLALSVTFLKDLTKSAPSKRQRQCLLFAWACLLATLVFATLHLFALTGHLTPKPGEAIEAHIRGSAVFFGAAQLATFLAGMAAFVWFARLTLQHIAVGRAGQIATDDLTDKPDAADSSV
ncbi:MAG: hypothetical protein DWQ36_05295 [Acidobacteria bacterium]|nr:MAG: hypothetical protein DWQ30_12785 [Acidobacteriota bacterium]REK10057.1 MAG: hypothetical protein DWQ36_05295 [Acidobacteriota bacterium]